MPTKELLPLAIVVLIALLPAVVGDEVAASPEAFEISWASIDHRGEVASGGPFELIGVVGQPDATALKGGAFTMQGGFFAIHRVHDLFEDGFETGDTSRWSGSNG